MDYIKHKRKKLGLALIASVVLHFTLINEIKIENKRNPPSGLSGTGGGDKNGNGTVKLTIIPKSETQGNIKCDNWYGGIGLTHDSLFVLTVAHGYPAYKAGVLPGDKTITDFDLLRGEPGTKIVFEILRNHTEYMRFDIVREKICEKY